MASASAGARPPRAAPRRCAARTARRRRDDPVRRQSRGGTRTAARAVRRSPAQADARRGATIRPRKTPASASGRRRTGCPSTAALTLASCGDRTRTTTSAASSGRSIGGATATSTAGGEASAAPAIADRQPVERRIVERAEPPRVERARHEQPSAAVRHGCDHCAVVVGRRGDNAGARRQIARHEQLRRLKRRCRLRTQTRRQLGQPLDRLRRQHAGRTANDLIRHEDDRAFANAHVPIERANLRVREAIEPADDDRVELVEAWIGNRDRLASARR